jgi:hypothetical protein
VADDRDRSRCPHAFARRTQKPFSSLWKVTRSTRPASTSWVDGSGCGFICVGAFGAVPAASGTSPTPQPCAVCSLLIGDIVEGVYPTGPFRAQLAAGSASTQRGQRGAAGPISQIKEKGQLTSPNLACPRLAPGAPAPAPPRPYVDRAPKSSPFVRCAAGSPPWEPDRPPAA